MSKYDELLTRLDHWSGFVTKNYADAAAAIRAQAKRIADNDELIGKLNGQIIGMGVAMREKDKRIAELETLCNNIESECAGYAFNAEAYEIRIRELTARLAAIDAYRGDLKSTVMQLISSQSMDKSATIDPEELAEALSVAREQGAADEREACAKIAENIGIRSDDPYASGEEIAEKIRARKGTGHES